SPSPKAAHPTSESSVGRDAVQVSLASHSSHRAPPTTTSTPSLAMSSHKSSSPSRFGKLLHVVGEHRHCGDPLLLRHRHAAPLTRLLRHNAHASAPTVDAPPGAADGQAAPGAHTSSGICGPEP